MKLRELIDNIMEKLNFNELERREVENGCDFDSTLEHYRSVVKDSIKESAEYFNEEELLESGAISPDGENIISFEVVKKSEDILETIVKVTDIC